jgi:hypothetical protein
MNIIKVEEDYTYCGIGNAPKVFRTRGCSCCSETVRITAESIAQAISEAEEWLTELRDMKPETYPEED